MPRGWPYVRGRHSVRQSCSLLFALRAMYLCMYLANMSIGLLALPLPVRFSSVSALVLVLSYSRLHISPLLCPARFVPPPPSISRIKIAGRAKRHKSRNAGRGTEDACALDWIGWLRLF